MDARYINSKMNLIFTNLLIKKNKNVSTTIDTIEEIENTNSLV